MALRHWPGHIVEIDSAFLFPMPAVEAFHEGQTPLLLTGPAGHCHRPLFLLAAPSSAQMKLCKVGKMRGIPRA